MSTLVVGLGQPVAGDDAAGLRVVDELQRRRVPGVSLARARDASSLLELLPADKRVVIVDAVLVGREGVGRVLELQLSDLDQLPSTSVSSHGIGVAQAIALASALHGERVTRDLWLVAIGISAPEHYHEGLSPEVSRAVEHVANRIEALAKE